MELTRHHLLSGDVELLLQFGMGICWIIAYLILIFKGFQDKSCGMPFAALCGNITWEFMYTFLFPQDHYQVYVNIIWFLLDVVILFQFIKYSRLELPQPLSEKWFFPTLMISLLLAFSLHYAIAAQFADFDGAFSAFGLNMMMSLLFVMMVFRRNHLKGQSMYIALFKWLGTCCASILCYSLFPDSILLLFLSISTFCLDALYILFLYQREKEFLEKKRPTQL